MTKPWNAHSERGFRKLGILLGILGFALTFCWSTCIYADPPPIQPESSTQTAPNLDQFHTICDDVLQKEDQLSETSPLAQKLLYCKTAKSSMSSSNSHSILWKVWASVSATCLGLCGWTPTGIPGAQYACTVASIGAGVAEAAVTKELTSILMSVTGAAVPLMMSSTSKKTASTVGTKTSANGKMAETNIDAAFNDKTRKTKSDLGACFQAAIAGVQTYINYNSMQTDEESAKKNLASAKKVSNNSGASIQASSASIATGTAPDGRSTKMATTLGQNSQNINQNTPDSPASICGNASQNGNAGMMIQCASSAQVDLPPFVSDPRFPQAFQAISGRDLGSFYKNASSPKSAIMQATAAILNPDQEGQLSHGLDQISNRLPSSNSIYTSSGGTAHATSDDSSDSTDQMLKDMMSQLLPKEPGEAEARNPATLVFGNQSLSPQQQAYMTSANSPWSIFDRIHNRCEAVFIHLSRER